MGNIPFGVNETMMKQFFNEQMNMCGLTDPKVSLLPILGLVFYTCTSFFYNFFMMPFQKSS